MAIRGHVECLPPRTPLPCIYRLGLLKLPSANLSVRIASQLLSYTALLFVGAGTKGALMDRIISCAIVFYDAPRFMNNRLSILFLLWGCLWSRAPCQRLCCCLWNVCGYPGGPYLRACHVSNICIPPQGGHRKLVRHPTNRPLADSSLFYAASVLHEPMRYRCMQAICALASPCPGG